MADFAQRNRQEYIVNGNLHSNPVNKDIYIEGNKRKVDLDRRLDELSTQSNLIVSGNSISRNVLNSSASAKTNISFVIDSAIYSDDDEDDKKDDIDSKYGSGLNRGKDIIEKMFAEHNDAKKR